MHRYLIDGYNLLHQMPELTGDDVEELEEQRERLIRRLISLSAGRRMQIHLVFDAPKSCSSRSNYPGLKVDYAAPSADVYIRRRIAHHSDDRNLVVVSSDRKDIGHYAKTCGVAWMTSAQFWKDITRPSRRRSGQKANFEKEGSALPGWAEDDDARPKRFFEAECGGEGKAKKG